MIPHRIREELNVEQGDKINWTVKRDSKHSAAVVNQRYGAFEDSEPAERNRAVDSPEDGETHDDERVHDGG